MGTAACETGSECFSCFQCHGIRGEGGAAAALPRLAGQDSEYLHRSQQAIASGERVNATMHEVAVGLTEQQKQDVASYYSTVTAPAPLRAPVEGDEGRAQAGLAIDQRGLPASGVPACMTCHSSAARPEGPPYPYLAGQFADYLEQQLAEFRAGTRREPDAQIMQVIARGLNDEHARAVSVHFASQPPPRHATHPPKP
jgi:cytochrome c553